MSTDNNPPDAERETEETIGTDWDGYDHPGTAVVERVSEVTGREETELPVLQSAVDVDALETLLLTDREGSVQVSFRYAGLRVTIRSDRTILLRGSDPSSD